MKHAKLHFAAHVGYRILHVDSGGTAEYRQGDMLGKPCAVYPTWEYGEDISVLEEMMHVNIADVPGACADESIPIEQRPVIGQEHRVLVINFPDANAGPGRRILRQLQEMQEEYPDCILHVHGVYSYRLAFGLGFGAADTESRTLAHKGEVFLPNGKTMKYEQTVKCAQWVTLLGMSPVDLSVPKNRCIYNIRSALWAGENFTEKVKFRVKGDGYEPDPSSSVAVLPTVGRIVSNMKIKAEEGDKFLCDTCSLQDTCKYFRAGGVCVIPGSEPAPLARMMNTRDADAIMDGLGTLMAVQTRRMERGIEDEEMVGELDPEVTKIINSLFANGVRLAKLLRPDLAGGTKVGVFVNGGNGSTAVVAGGDPKQLVAGLVRELEARGIPRDQITPKMIEGLANPDREAIDATVVEEHAS